MTLQISFIDGLLRQRSVQSVKQLHSLGIFHGDLEPQNVAETLVGFKFFDFGRSELHHCQQGQCGELQDFVERTELPVHAFVPRFNRFITFDKPTDGIDRCIVAVVPIWTTTCRSFDNDYNRKA